MTLYCGIDLHSTNSLVSIINDDYRIVFEKRLPNDFYTIMNQLEPHQNQIAGLVVESTYNWYWLVDGLQEAGFNVHLANTVAIKQYDGIKHTNDETDARFLAHLFRLGILPVGTIMPKSIRRFRDLLRRRLLLVRQRTLQQLSLQSLITRHTGLRFSSNRIKRLNEETLCELFPDSMTRLAAQSAVYLIRAHQVAIEQLEKQVSQHCQHQPEFQLLTSIPGVGPILGQTILLETGRIHRFKTAGNFASYARCVNSQKMSNGKCKGSSNRKNGNRYLAWAFIEAAHLSAIWSPEIKRFYQRKKSKVHLMVAKKTVANKLARAIFHMLNTQTPFDAKRAFG